jgi:tryptophan synthase beta subunit
MMAMSGSGCSAIGMASFSRSEALRFAGAEGGGAGVPAAGTGLAELGWPREELHGREKASSAARMTWDLGRIMVAHPEQCAGLAFPVLGLVGSLRVFMGSNVLLTTILFIFCSLRDTGFKALPR